LAEKLVPAPGSHSHFRLWERGAIRAASLTLCVSIRLAVLGLLLWHCINELPGRFGLALKPPGGVLLSAGGAWDGLLLVDSGFLRRLVLGFSVSGLLAGHRCAWRAVRCRFSSLLWG